MHCVSLLVVLTTSLSMSGLLHRVWAVVVVLALLGAVPATTPRGCEGCPVECPMHRPAKTLGCHHGDSGDSGQAAPAAAMPDGQPCLRPAVCGHAPVAMPAMLRAVVETAHLVLPVVLAGPIAPAAFAMFSLAGPAPPHGPPRSLSV